MYFPITIIDNFYNDFDKVLSFVNQIKFNKKTKHTMPGLQTEDLKTLNNELFRQSVKKVLSVFYDRYMVDNIKFECRTRFEKMVPFGKEYNNKGWIHSDDTNKLTGILYIQGEYNEGTSIYKNKEVGLYNEDNFFYKKTFYSDNFIEPNLYNEKLKQHNSKFEEILNIPCISNRLVLFDSSMLHGSNGLGSLNKPRIIQTFFFGHIESDNFPIPEIKRY